MLLSASCLARLQISEGIQDLGHQLEDELLHEQEVVAKTRVQVQRDFLAVAKFVPIENATRKGAEEGSRVRKQMWELLCSQVESGLGSPNDGQLDALWQKYDGNSDGELSPAELRGVLIDYSAAMTARLNKHLPVLKRRLAQASANGTINPFVELVTTAFTYECEAQLALYRAQSEGRITEDALRAVSGRQHQAAACPSRLCLLTACLLTACLLTAGCSLLAAHCLLPTGRAAPPGLCRSP